MLFLFLTKKNSFYMHMNIRIVYKKSFELSAFVLLNIIISRLLSGTAQKNLTFIIQHCKLYEIA